MGWSITDREWIKAEADVVRFTAAGWERSIYQDAIDEVPGTNGQWIVEEHRLICSILNPQHPDSNHKPYYNEYGLNEEGRNREGVHGERLLNVYETDKAYLDTVVTDALHDGLIDELVVLRNREPDLKSRNRKLVRRWGVVSEVDTDPQIKVKEAGSVA